MSQGTLGLCLHKDRLYRASIHDTGINVVHFLKGAGWVPAKTVPRGARSTARVSLASDGDTLYMFYRHGTSGPGKAEPVHVSVLDGETWQDPVPVKDVTASDSPAAVAVPGQKGKFYLLFTRNHEIYLASPPELKKAFKPLRQIGK